MKLTPEKLENRLQRMRDAHLSNTASAILGHIDAQEAELAEQTRLVDVWQGKWRRCEDKFQKMYSHVELAQVAHLAHIAALEATLRNADGIGYSISAEDWDKERDALLATSETAVKPCEFCDGQGHEAQKKCVHCDGSGTNTYDFASEAEGGK